jgi:hypothetical protein
MPAGAPHAVARGCRPPSKWTCGRHGLGARQTGWVGTWCGLEVKARPLSASPHRPTRPHAHRTRPGSGRPPPHSRRSPSRTVGARGAGAGLPGCLPGGRAGRRPVWFIQIFKPPPPPPPPLSTHPDQMPLRVGTHRQGRPRVDSTRSPRVPRMSAFINRRPLNNPRARTC